MNGRLWTQSELTIVRERTAAGETAAQLAARLGKSLSSIYQCRRKLGLHKPLRHTSALLDPFIRELHARELCDPEIVAEWTRLQGATLGPISREWVSERRRAMGLPSNALSLRRRALIGQKTREQLAAAGLRSMADLRIAAHRKLAIDSGWPADLRLRETQILNLIWERGPLTKREICEALNMPFRGARNTLRGNDKGGTYMATLMRRGLLIKFRRAVRTGRRGGNVDLYSLSLDVQRKRVS